VCVIKNVAFCSKYNVILSRNETKRRETRTSSCVNVRKKHNKKSNGVTIKGHVGKLSFAWNENDSAKTQTCPISKNVLTSLFLRLRVGKKLVAKHAFLCFGEGLKDALSAISRAKIQKFVYEIKIFMPLWINVG